MSMAIQCIVAYVSRIDEIVLTTYPRKLLDLDWHTFNRHDARSL